MITLGQITGKLQRAVVGNADQILMNVVVHLFEIQHHQIDGIQQLIDHRIVAAHKTVGVQTGIDPFFMAGAEPIADEFCLQYGFTTGGRYATAGGIHKVTIRDGIFHQLFNGHFFPAVGIPGVTVMAIQAAHQAALEEDDKTDTWAINGATGFEGVNSTDH
ncbi:hypothetical protein D3C71_1762660 [compost metagenome]